MSAVLDKKPAQGLTNLEWLPVVAGLLLLYIPTFYDLARMIWVRPEYAYGPIILAVVIWLIWDRRQVLQGAPAGAAPLPGIAVLAAGLLIYVAGRSQGILLFEVGSLAPVLAGVLLATRGWPALRSYWFMLLFIVYLLPVPAYFQDAMTMPLKRNVSVLAEFVLYAAGYPVAHDGIVISIGQYQLLVADACSGLNSIFSLTAVGLLYLYLMRRRSWLHNGLILASLLPIAFTANVVRVITLILVTYHFGDAAGQGFVHSVSGILLFVISLIIILCLDAILASLIKSRVATR